MPIEYATKVWKTEVIGGNGPTGGRGAFMDRWIK
jgi:hypothetical protein